MIISLVLAGCMCTTLPATFPVLEIERDPFYLSPVVKPTQSRYDLRSPRVVGIIHVDGLSRAIIKFDDTTEVVVVGNTTRGHLVVSIGDGGVVVRDSSQREKRWVI